MNVEIINLKNPSKVTQKYMSQFIKIPKIVHHDTTSNYVDDILEEIKIKKGSEIVDFGQGFYTTTHYEQAVRQGIRKAKDHNREEEKNFVMKRNYKRKLVTPSVISYLVNDEQLTLLGDFYIFQNPSVEWAEFIYNNRKRKYDLTDYHNWDQKFHFVFGPMGDSTISTYLRLYDKGEITLEELAKQITPQPEPGTFLLQDQLSFHTKDAVQCLKVQGVKRNAVPGFFAKKY